MRYMFSTARHSVLGQFLSVSLMGCAADEADVDPIDVTPRAGLYTKQTTVLGGQDYVDECKMNGVPVPNTVNDFAIGWDLHDDLEFPFLHPELAAELWTFDSEELDGLCMSLARINVLANEREIVEMICMGRATSKTCFFVTPEGTGFPGTQELEILDLNGGTELLQDNPEGVCSDCHAGENPFVVHPQDPAFVEALTTLGHNVFPQKWPTPIVPDPWPGNPEPIGKLGPTPDGAVRCDDCHTEQGGAGRLPLVSTAFPRYCAEVLGPAVGEQPGDPVPNTMPPSGNGVIDDYADHRDWLVEACDAAPGNGQSVPFTPPTTVLLPAPLVEPPFTCSKHVTVSSTRPNATIKVYVANSPMPVATAVHRGPGEKTFTLATAFLAGQLVEATQTIGASTSPRGKATVKDYPYDLPPPSIQPRPIYRCAKAIAVSHVRGATLTVRKTESDGATPPLVTLTSGDNFTKVDLTSAGAFDIGDTFEAKQRLCANDDSVYSEPVAAQEEPDSLPMVTFQLPRPGQEFITLDDIVQGSHVLFKEQPSMVIADRPSVPFHHVYDIDLLATPLGPIVASDQLVATQDLCGMTSDTPSPPMVGGCTSTAIPKIARPLHDDKFVLVLESVPGATLRVFGTPGITEIGNGMGDVIALTRKLVGGETIVVTEFWPTCTPNRGFSIVVALP